MNCLLYFFFFLAFTSLGANTRSDQNTSPGSSICFGGIDSKITMENDTVLDVDSKMMYVNGGHIDRKELAEINGYPIYFTRGKISSYLSTSWFSGRYEGTQSNIDVVKQYINPDELNYGVLELGYDTDPSGLDYVISNPGGFRQKIYVRSGLHVLRGQPLFFGKNDVILQDKNCGLAMAIQNALNSNVIMNGGLILLQDDLSLGDDAVFQGDGQVVFNNRRLALGGNTAYWTGNIIWNSAFDMQLNSLTFLRGVWTFYGDGQVNGNGNVLDIAGGGSIIVSPGSRLRLSGVKIKGLGSGNLIMGEGSELRLSDVDIEMDADFTFNSGHLVIDGDTYVLTKDKLMTFAANAEVSGVKGKLTVDRVALTYDPLDFEDRLNIRPLAIQDPTHEFIEIINNGSIRKPRIESISFVSYGSSTAMARYAVLWPDRPMTLYPEWNSEIQNYNYDITINGNTQFIGFSTTDKPLLFVSDNVHATYENVYFRDFSPKHLSLGTNSSLVFGNNTTVKLWNDDTLDKRWIFRKNTALRGGGAILTFEGDGEIVLEGENAVLYIEGVQFKGLSGTKIRCTHNSSKIIFKDVEWIQDGTFTFSTGGIDVLGDWMLVGPGKPLTFTSDGKDVVGAYTFNYTSNQKINILDNGLMAFTRGMKFNYQPISGATDLITMFNNSSSMLLDESVLCAPAPGLQLTNGRLTINGRCFYKNDNSSNYTTGIIWGDGIADDNLFIEKRGGSSFEGLSGFYQNMNIYPK